MYKITLYWQAWTIILKSGYQWKHYDFLQDVELQNLILTSLSSKSAQYL